MALNRITNFNWEKLLSRVSSLEAKRPILAIRANVNQVLGATAKHGSPPAEIDFSAHRKKLRFTASAVDALEKAYKKRDLPTFDASVSELELQKRAATEAVLARIVQSAALDSAELKEQAAQLARFKISNDTSTGEIEENFPSVTKGAVEDLEERGWEAGTARA